MSAEEHEWIALFGPYRFDSARRELTKHGSLIKVQSKPLDVLSVLVSKHGETISREELRKALWQEHVFVDFEKNLNTAVNKLRAVLGDDFASPRYIETVPRRGYRFTAPVKVEAPRRSPEGAAQLVESKVREPESHDSVGDRASRVAYRESLWFKLLVVAGLVMLALVGALSANLDGFRSSGKDTIVLAGFTNETGDPVFDEPLERALAIQLRRSSSWNILAERKVRESLSGMGQIATQPLTVPVAQEVCRRTHSAAVIHGTISGLGSEYVVSVEALSCANGNSLAQAQAEASRKEEVLHTLSSAINELRDNLKKSIEVK